MSRHLLSRAVLAAVLLGGMMAAPGFAQSGAEKTAADCGSFKGVDRRETWKADDRDVMECVWRGWDPPVEWRRNEGRSAGISVGGSGGFAVGSRQAPNMPPGKAGANSSVSKSLFNFTLKFPPWRGFPCQLPGGKDICGGDGGGGGGGDGTGVSCAMAAASADLGGRQPVTGTSAIELPCGGALPLSTYQLTLNPGATGILATEAGSHNYWSYAQSGNDYAQTSAAGARLPTHLCRKNSDGEWVKSVDIKPAIAQMITYSSGSTIAIRLQGEYAAEVSNPFDTATGEAPEKFLIVPIRGGVPAMPADCANEETYYKPISGVSDAIIIQSATTPGCEAPADMCGSTPTTPTASGTCDVATLNPTGPSSTSTGTVNCDGKTLIAVLDRPNMIYQPGSRATFAAMQGRTAVMARAASGARIFSQFDTIMYFGASGQQFTLPEGGEMKLNDGSTLEMKEGAQIRAASRQVMLLGGGAVRSQGGKLLQTLPSNTLYTPIADMPFAVRVSRSVALPIDYTVPSQPSPYVQLPIDTE